VTTAAGEWRLGAADPVMLAALIDGTAEAASEKDPAQSSGPWRADRRASLAEGMLRLAVGHVDILAEPDESPMTQG